MAKWQEMVAALTEAGVAFEDGLTDAEVGRVETRFGFRFPADLRAFLQTALPVARSNPREPGTPAQRRSDFPNWRQESESSLRDRLQTPLEGILFDIEFNGFWLPEWGPRPVQLSDAKDIVRQLVATAPVLIPIYAHRMMPDRPHEAGNPVFSVHQTDIIYYGIDLRDYLLHEFISQSDLGVWPICESPRPIEFWDIVRFAEVHWARGVVVFDNRKGVLP